MGRNKYRLTTTVNRKHGQGEKLKPVISNQRVVERGGRGGGLYAIHEQSVRLSMCDVFTQSHAHGGVVSSPLASCFGLCICWTA